MISARRVEDGVHGAIYERTFHSVRGDGDVEVALDRATRAGALVEFRLDDNGLLTRRKWFEGTPLDRLFRDADDGERRRQSTTLFSRLGQEISRLEDAGLAHGAIHPSNVLIANGLQLVDAVANTTRLGVSGSGSGPGWLWHAERPAGVTWAEWDRANLLRMATLLGLPAERNAIAEGPAAVLAMCREWAANAIEALPSGSHSERAIQQALQDAQRVAGAAPRPPPSTVNLAKPPSETPVPSTPIVVSPSSKPIPAPGQAALAASADVDEDALINEIADGLFRTNAEHMLRTRLEDQIIQIASGRGVPAERARQLLTHWLRRKDYAREADLLEEARRNLRAGVHHSVWVPVNVAMNTQRSFTHYKVSAQDAENFIASLLRELSLRDEREGEREWNARLDAYAQKNCPKKTFTVKQRAEMGTLVSSFGIPRDMADQVTKRFLDRNGFTEKTGWW